MEILTSFEHFHHELWIGIRIGTKLSHFTFWLVSFDSLFPPGLMEIKDEALPMKFGSASHYHGKCTFWVKMLLINFEKKLSFWFVIEHSRSLRGWLGREGIRTEALCVWRRCKSSDSDASDKTSLLPLNRVHLAAGTFHFLCLSV